MTPNPTSVAYQIKSVADFLTVPPEHRATCLAQFLDFLRLADDVLAAHPGKYTESLEFVWTDDGKSDVTIQTEVLSQ